MIKLVSSPKRSLSEFHVSSKFYASEKQDIFQRSIFARGFVPLNLKISSVMMISQDVEIEWLFLFQNFCQRYKVKMLSFNFFTMFSYFVCFFSTFASGFRMQLNLSALPKSTQVCDQQEKKNERKNMKNYNITMFTSIRGSFTEGAGSISQLIWDRMTSKWSVECAQARVWRNWDWSRLLLVMIRNKLFTVFCRRWFITIKIFEMERK